MSLTFFQNFLAVLSAAAGAAAASAIGFTHKQLCALISFAAGTLLATALFSIIPESVSVLPLWSLALAVVSGYALFHFISHKIFHVCPACAASHFDEHVASNFKSIAVLLSIALGIHSTMDGLAIAVANQLGSRADLSLFITVMVHKFPEGLALCALLLKSGFTKPKALLYSIALESTTFLGWFLGEFFRINFHAAAIHWVLVHVAGGFIYLAVHAVVNESREHSPRFVISFFTMGMALIGLSHFLGV